MVEHGRDTLVRKLYGWALQGYVLVRHCRDTWWLGAAGILCGSALQGYFVVGHCRDTWWFGTTGILCGWALQGYFVVGLAGILGGWSLKSASSRARTTSTLKSNNPTARVGNKEGECKGGPV